MKKISTLFKKDPANLGRVTNEINPENQWVFDGEGNDYQFSNYQLPIAFSV